MLELLRVRDSYLPAIVILLLASFFASFQPKGPDMDTTDTVELGLTKSENTEAAVRGRMRTLYTEIPPRNEA